MIPPPAAWIPFINPLYSAVPHLTAIWLLLIFPLVVIISLVYQTIRRSDLSGLVLGTLWMSAKVIFFMALIAVMIQLVFYLSIHYLAGPLN
jgi:multisubunit Na+/H+ antiporter MnhF subunit